MDDLPDQLDKRANTYNWDSATFYISDAHMMRQAAAEIRSLREQVAQTAEFICRKCGRRQDGHTDNEARF
jgi:hypothetical protein